MAGEFAFTDNVRDLSNGDGYQFEFVCERCGNGYRSAFVRDKGEMGRGLLRGVGGLFGGRMQQMSNFANDMSWNRGTNSPAKDRAMRSAVDEIAPKFTQCHGCGDWVCRDICWNTSINQCVRCSPRLGEELSRIQSAAQFDQLRTAAQNVDFTRGIDVGARGSMACPTCGAHSGGGKFCSSCGSSLAINVRCGGCGSEANQPGAVFCANCGSRL